MTDAALAARDLLARRARQLSNPLSEGELSVARDGSSTTALLVIRVADERVGIALDHITEVHRTGALTPIPGAGTPVQGVIAWRGRVLTVLDIAHSRSGPIVLTDATRILVLGQQRGSFGVIADDVEDVQDVNLQQVASVDNVAPTRHEFVRGVMDDALVILDAAALITRFAPTH